MDFDFVRHGEIVARKLDDGRIDFDRHDLDTRAIQHGGQRAAAQPDHQDAGRARLAQQPVHGVIVFGEADALRIGLALLGALLPVGDRAGGIVLLDDEGDGRLGRGAGLYGSLRPDHVFRAARWRRIPRP